MIAVKKRERGISLVEMLLVLILGGAIIFLSMRQYQVFRQDADVQQLEANVDTLFQAMTQYYRANCYGTQNPTSGILTPGTLNPMNATSPLPGPRPINIDTDLVARGYLPANTPFPANPIVNDAGAGTSRFKGYVAQFNVMTSTRTTSGTTVGTVVIWKPQIAVLVRNTALAQQYLRQSGGDCLSTLNGNTVRTCIATSTGTYIVWERLPSYASTRGNSNLWQARARLNQFTQMYSVYPTPNLLTRSGQTPANQTQYYLCGG